MSRLFRCSQQSDLWFCSRRGRITGSRLRDMMAEPTTRASTRNGVQCPAGTEALAKATYRRELVVERITNVGINHFVTRAMEDGIERERFARMLYEADTQQVVELVGFALHPQWDFFGASVDGLCEDAGGVEFKCPTELTHDLYLSDPQALADEYQWQCIAGFICFPDRQWWDLVSFGPHFPDPYKLIRYRFHRSDVAEKIKATEEAAWKFNEEIEAEIARRGLPPTVWDIMPESVMKPSPENYSDKEIADYGSRAYDFLNDHELTP